MMFMDVRGVLDHRLLLSLLIHDLRDFYDVYVNQLNICCIARWGIEEIPQRDHDYDHVYVHVCSG